VVVGPVVLTLARELWNDRVQRLAMVRVTAEEHVTRRHDIPPNDRAAKELGMRARKPLSGQCSLLT
jgi:hypothetical protein